MNVSKVIEELEAHIVSTVSDHEGVEVADLHNALFNQDYYVIGYYNATQLLEKWDLEAFEVIEYVQEYEKDNFGQTNTAINSESMVNMLVYIVGEEVLYTMLQAQEIDHDGVLSLDDINLIKEY